MEVGLLRTFAYNREAQLVFMPIDKMPADAVYMGLNWYMKIEEYVTGPLDMIEEYKKVFTDGDNL